MLPPVGFCSSGGMPCFCRLGSVARGRPFSFVIMNSPPCKKDIPSLHLRSSSSWVSLILQNTFTEVFFYKAAPFGRDISMLSSMSFSRKSYSNFWNSVLRPSLIPADFWCFKCFKWLYTMLKYFPSPCFSAMYQCCFIVTSYLSLLWQKATATTTIVILCQNKDYNVVYYNYAEFRRNLQIRRY